MRLLFILSLFCVSAQSWAADIEFADDAVRTLCLANWDADEDGQLSTDEAAAVTDLGAVFREQKTIASFDELKFFTGLTTIGEYAFYKSSIQRVTLPPSVTSIGEYAFSESAVSGELRIPGNVSAIRNYAFYNCRQLTSVVLEDGVQTVGWHSFSGPIRLLSLPPSLSFMSSMAIDPYVNTSSSGIFLPEGDLYVCSHATVPPAINDFAFYYVYGDGHLIVPFGCAADYKAAWPWSQFREYIETGDVNRDGRVDVADLTLLIAYIGGHEHTDMDALIADVNGDGVLDGEDVSLLCQYLLGS